MDSVLDIDVWAREIAMHEAAAVRSAVRDAIAAGCGAVGALHAVRRRMSRLTPAQQEIVVEEIGRDPEAPR